MEFSNNTGETDFIYYVIFTEYVLKETTKWFRRNLNLKLKLVANVNAAHFERKKHTEAKISF